MISFHFSINTRILMEYFLNHNVRQVREMMSYEWIHEFARWWWKDCIPCTGYHQGWHVQLWKKKERTKWDLIKKGTALHKGVIQPQGEMARECPLFWIQCLSSADNTCLSSINNFVIWLISDSGWMNVPRLSIPYNTQVKAT